MVNVFAVPVFFIVFRETLETTIVVSVLLAFLKQQIGPLNDKAVYNRLRKQVWLGILVGFVICLIIGCGMIGAFYSLGTDKWAGTEDIWEGVFALFACIIITIMGAALLRVSKLQDKWRVKLAKALEVKNSHDQNTKRFSSQRLKLLGERYAMFILPFITILREGLEAVVFIGGISLGLPASAIPLPTVCGLLAGCAIGFLIYKGGNRMPLQIFLIASTCFLYLVAAGLFTRAVWYFENNAWSSLTGGDAAETGSGAGSYDIRSSVWHVNCCNPELNGGGGWGIFNALFGWTNSATYGTVISYNLYWGAVICGFILLRFKETKGRWPFFRSSSESGATTDRKSSEDDFSGSDTVATEKDIAGKEGPAPTVGVRAVSNA